MTDKNSGSDQTKMVEWYNPSQLLETAKKTAISTIIGENADPRLVTAPASVGKFFDYSTELSVNSRGEFENDSKARPEIRIDYVSDVGDGWNSTYSVAYSLVRPVLSIGETELRRGEILIFGGDQVYPTATADEYEKRFIKPYRTAFETHRQKSDDQTDAGDLNAHPHVFALPGNHDWYDSLVAFYNIFCTHLYNGRRFANGWRTRQKRSYFVLKLPHKWWLLGVDLQLSHNIDVRQLQYLESVAEKMERGDKVILCVPEPFWVKAIKYQGFTDVFQKKEQSIEILEKIFEKKGVEVKVYIAGDLHHYRRFESEDGRRIQKITAGGGGAFLHPTHDFDFEKAFAGRAKTDQDFTLETQYPTAEVSRSLDWQNLYKFLWNNKSFGLVTAVLYPFLALLIHGEISGKFEWSKTVKVTINRLIEEPISLLIVVAMIAGLIFFTDSKSKLQKYLGGLLHGLTHLAAAFVLGWFGFFLMLWILGYGMDTLAFEKAHQNQPTVTNLIWFICVSVVGALGGYVVGSLIMGIYLFVSLHLLGRHDNEAFSALRIEDYKNFLRLHISADGQLTIYPLKIETVEREWQSDDAERTCRPSNNLQPELIEEPIVIR